METTILDKLATDGPAVTHTEPIYQGKIINVRVDTLDAQEHGEPAKREVVEHPGGVCVIPVLPDGRIVFVRQYRHPVGLELLELPAGKLDVKGETFLKACQRELWEEAGCISAYWEDLGFIYPAPGFSNEKIYLYRAGKVALTTEDYDNPEEGTSIVILTWNEVLELLANNMFRDGKTLALLGMELLRRV